MYRRSVRTASIPARAMLTALCLSVVLSAAYFAVQWSQADAQVGPGDWPMPNYNNGSTRYNTGELQLYPPISTTPDQEIQLDPDVAEDTHRPTPVIADGRVFWHMPFSNPEATFHATDMEGNVLWSISFPDTVLSFHPVKVAGDKVLIPAEGFLGDDPDTLTRRLMVADAATGDLHWDFPVYGQSFTVHNGVLYSFWQHDTLDEQYLSAVRLSDNTELYRQPVEFFRGYTYEPLIHGSTIYLYEGSELHAYNLDTGELRWVFDDEDNSSTVDTYTAAAAGIVVISQGDRMVGVDANSGAEIWDSTINEDCWADDTVPVTDGTYLVQVGVCGSQLHGFLLASGTPVWDEELEHFASQPAAAANGILYTAPFPNNAARIQAYSMATGQLLQDFSPGYWVSDLMIANGTLYATALNQYVLGYEMGGDADGYLESWTDDGNALTNPGLQTELPLTRRTSAGGDSDYGAEIQVAAFIGTEPATLRVYTANDSLYKEATTAPDRHGHGYWVVPVEYTAAGYQYEVELGDGERLGRRTVRMPSDPDSNLRLIELLDGLSWVNAPGTVTNFPAEIALALPGEMPDGPVEALLMVDSPQRGSVFVAGERDGDRVVFTLTRNNIVQGNFTISAVARGGNVAAFSSDHQISFQSASLPSYLPSQVTTVGHASDGSLESVTYQYERDRPAPDSEGTIDAQIGQIIPYGGGHHVIVHVTTPSETDPEKALERPHKVQVSGRDGAGNPISQDLLSLPPNLDETPVTFELPQNGARLIEQIEVSALEPDPFDMPDPFPTPQPPPPPPPPPLMCEDTPQDDPPEEDEEDEDENRSWRLRDLFSVSTSGGVSASGAYYVGAGGGSSVSYDWIQRKSQACLDYGARGGMELGVGPSYGMNFGLNMRGPGHDAPANSGKKVNITAAAGIGVDLSYTIPDNWQTSGFGTISLGLTAQPKAGVSAGISRVHCDDLNNNEPPPNSQRRECCNGPCNNPPGPPDTPGETHPDDTLSVVLFNAGANVANNEFAALDSWASLGRQARSVGYWELAEYAFFRTRLDVLGLQMADYPSDVALDELTEAQQQTVADYLYERTHQGQRMQAQWGTILSQWERVMADSAQVLAGGYFAETLNMLESYGIPTRLISANFSPDEMSGLLIIPSGGLFGLADVESFRARLDRFVEQGGTLLVMSQPESDSLDALPGADSFSQVGYMDDISCFQDAMTVKEFHPMLASLNSSTIDSHVDGYLTALPPNAQLLLERTKNQQGAFALYPHGAGYMVVTNLYDDWGRTVGQSSPQVRDLFRDVVRWGADPADMPDVRPNGSVQVPVEVVNRSPEDATSRVRFVVRDPNEQEVARLDPSGLNLAPGASQTAAANVTAPQGPLGIWRVNYELLDDDDNVIQQETMGSRFTVSDPPDLSGASVAQAGEPQFVTTEPPAANVSAALDQAAYNPGDTVAITLEIEVPDWEELNQLRVVASLGETTDIQYVPAQANQQVQFNFPADFSSNGLLYFGVYDENTGQGMVLNTIWVAAQGEHVTVTPDRFAYAPGETVSLQVQSDSARAVYFQGPGIDREVSIPGGSSTVDFDLPATMSSGPYTVRYNDGSNLRAVSFDVKGPRVRVESIELDDTTAAVNSDIPGQIHLWSDRDIDVFLAGMLAEPGGNISQVFLEEVSLVEGAQTLPITVPFAVEKGGISQFRVAVTDRANPMVEYARATRNLATNTPELMAARAGEITTAAGQETLLLLDWYSPAARTVDVTVYDQYGELLAQQVSVGEGFTTSELALTVPGGSYDLIVAGEVDGLTTTASAVVVVESLEWLYLPDLQR